MIDAPDEDWDPYDDDFDPRDDCDCLDAEVDILTGIERCHVCGRSRVLNSEEFSLRLKQEAEWAEAYYAEIQKDYSTDVFEDINERAGG